MGRIVSRIARVVTSVVGMSGGPLGAIMKGVGGLMGKGGISALGGPMKMFSKLSQMIMGKLGGMGLRGMRPPMQHGRIGMPYSQPSHGAAGAPRPGGNIGPSLNATESRALGTVGRLENQQKALMDRLSDPNLSQAERMKIQQQLEKIKQMMEQITKALGSMNKVLSSMIRNISG